MWVNSRSNPAFGIHFYNFWVLRFFNCWGEAAGKLRLPKVAPPVIYRCVGFVLVQVIVIWKILFCQHFPNSVFCMCIYLCLVVIFFKFFEKKIHCVFPTQVGHTYWTGIPYVKGRSFLLLAEPQWAYRVNSVRIIDVGNLTVNCLVLPVVEAVATG